MKRDNDFVRELLLMIEAANSPSMSELLPAAVTEVERRKFEYHLHMLIDQARFVTGIGIGDESGGEDWLDLELTWNGHEFLDAVRDPDIWRKTKDGASRIGSAGIELLWEIAKAQAKQLIIDKLGLGGSP